MFPWKQRLRTKKNINSVFAQGRRAYHPLMRLIVLPTEEAISKVTVVVSKKVSLKAVVRNKVKRRMRELLRNKLNQVEGSYNMLLVAQPKAVSASVKELSNALDVLFSKHQL